MGGRSEPSAHATIGSGKRFSSLERSLSHEKGVRNPAALAAALGRAKYGSRGFAHLSAIGRKRHSRY